MPHFTKSSHLRGVSPETLSISAWAAKPIIHVAALSLLSKSRNFEPPEAYGQVSEQLPAIRGFKASIHLDHNTEDRFCSPRTVPVHLELEVCNKLQRLESLGIITPCSYKGIPNASPVVWARKKSGDLHLCADYKVHINSQINNYAYPMPNTETIMAGLDSAKFFPCWI